MDVESPPEPAITASARLVPIAIGDAVVFVQQVGPPPAVEVDERIYPVGAPSLSDAFDRAGDMLREVLRLVDERTKQLDDATRPDHLTVEFSLSFEVSGKASVIPIFVTGETGLQTGLKVVAVWDRNKSG